MTDTPDPEWNPSDYVFAFPESSFPGGPLVEMPLIHKVNKVREYLAEVLGGSGRCITIGAEIPATLAGLAVVDYLAGFYAGKQSQSTDYIAFMDRYFPDRYRPHLRAVYTNLRCGLMHNLVAANPWQGQHPPFLLVGNCEPHMAIEGDRIVYCVLQFLEDVRRAWIKYAHDLILRSDDNPLLVKHFERRFNKLCGIGAFMVKVSDESNGTT